MSPDIEGPKPPIRAAVYRGPTGPKWHDRGTNAFIPERMPDGKGFDQRLVDQMERVRASGKTQLVLLDIGSGDGGLFTSFLDIPGDNHLSRGFLSDHPDFSIRMIGLTDSPSAEKQNTPKPFYARTDLDSTDRRINQQVRVKNIYWSLTRNQTLDEFLRRNGVDSIDLAVSTEALKYLSVPVFGEALRAVLQRLTPGGQFLGQGFAGSEPGIRSDQEHKFWETEISSNDKTPWKRLLMDNTYGRSTRGTLKLTPPFETEEEGETALQKAIDKYKALHALSDDEVSAQTEFLENRPEYQTATPKQKIMARANLTLALGFLNLRFNRRERMYGEKLDLLQDLGRASGNIDLFQGLSGETLRPNSFKIIKPTGGQNE